MHALVVDDSRAMRRIVGRIVSGLGFDVLEAGDGGEALECLQGTSDVTLALVDWNMPGMDGIDFVRAVRANNQHDNIRLMMVTAQTGAEGLKMALDAGADEYLMKPFTAEQLVEKLELLGIGAQ